MLRDHPETLRQVIGYGYSQSARFLRTFVYQGFNADERGRQAFDGLFVASAAGRGSFNHRYAMPGCVGNSVLSVLRPVDLFPFTDDMESDGTTHSSGALPALAQQSQTLPKVFYTYSSTEYWARVGSLASTTVDGSQDARSGGSSRLYYIAGTPHAPGAFPPAHSRPPSNQRYEYLMNYGSPIWAFHALLLALDQWVSKGTPPQASAYPPLAKSELVSRRAVQFPLIRGVEFPPYLPRNWRMDYGPDSPRRGLSRRNPPRWERRILSLSPRWTCTGTRAAVIDCHMWRCRLAPLPDGITRCPAWRIWIIWVGWWAASPVRTHARTRRRQATPARPSQNFIARKRSILTA